LIYNNKKCTRKNATLEFEHNVGHSVSNIVKLDEAGKMLGGWNGQLAKQNSPAKAGEK